MNADGKQMPSSAANDRNPGVFQPSLSARVKYMILIPILAI
jgi:hypothetical protein